MNRLIDIFGAFVLRHWGHGPHMPFPDRVRRAVLLTTLAMWLGNR